MKKNLFFISGIATLVMLSSCSMLSFSTNTYTGIIESISVERYDLTVSDAFDTLKMTFIITIDDSEYIGEELEVVTYDKDKKELLRDEYVFDNSMKIEIEYYEEPDFVENLVAGLLGGPLFVKVAPNTEYIYIFDDGEVVGTAQINEMFKFENPFK